MGIKNKSILLFSLAIIINFLLSYGVLLYQQPFNVDGIVYLNTAVSYLSQGFHSATAVYNWPFYSIYLAILSQMTHLSLINTAWLMNALLTSILIVFFLLLIEEVGGGLREQCWGLLIILIYPYLNHDRYNILRDFGYYAFYVVSLWSLIKFTRQKKWAYALLWQLVTWFAISFRFEGVIILCFAPLAVFFIHDWSWKERLSGFFKLNSLNILLLIVALIVCKECWHYGRIPELVNEVRPMQVLATFQQKMTVIQQQVFDVFGKNNAGLFLFGGLFALFIKAIIDTLGLFYILLTGYAVFSKDIRFQDSSRAVIVTYAMIVLATLVGFLSQQLFLSSRYVVPLALLMMLWIPFALEKLWQKNKVMLKVFLCIFFLIIIIDSIVFFGPSKTYLIKAGDWIESQTLSQAKLYTNDPQLYYYAHREGLNYPNDFPDQHWWPRLQQANLSQYDYVAIAIRHDESMPTEQTLIQLIGKNPSQTFENKRKDRVYIFDIENKK